MASMMPTRESLRILWMEAFADGVVANAAAYFVDPVAAAAMVSTVQTAATAYAAATNPETRTRGTVAAKNTLMDEAAVVCLRHAKAIKYNDLISDQLKLNVGVTPPNHSRSPVPAPDTAPVIGVVGATEGSHTLTYADSVLGEERPRGVTNIQIYRVIADEAVETRDHAQFYSAFRKNPIGVEFAEADDGKVATYFARWADAKGRVGPWSVPTSMRIAA